MIPVAAFAVSATGVSAFNGDIIEKLNIELSTSQIEALEESHELRRSGAFDEARAVLEEANIDHATMHEIRSAVHAYRMELREAIHTAIETADYDEFVTLIGDGPLSEHITSQADFERFIEAHELMAEGEFAAAKDIMQELGIERESHRHGAHIHHGGSHRGERPINSSLF